MALRLAEDRLRPKTTRASTQAELDYIAAGGALVTWTKPGTQGRRFGRLATWSYIKQLLSNRMLLGVYIGQYCITTLTYFFLTWFPVYLVKERHMTILKAGFVAALPAICGLPRRRAGRLDVGPPAASRLASRCRWRARRPSSSACCCR
jgi:hypothetical protein